MLVDTFIAGAPKCGTTSMAYYLSKHPSICVSQPKETWFFVSESFGNKPKYTPNNIPQYHSNYFKNYDPNVHQVLIDSSPIYLHSEQTIKNIISYNPSAKFIILLRNPIDMFISWHSQLLWSNDETETDPETAWNLQLERLDGRSIPNNSRNPTLLHYQTFCSLGDQITNLNQLAKKNHVHHVLMDDMLIDCRQTYIDALNFLDLPDDGQTKFPTLNSRKQRRHPSIEKIIWNAARFKDKYIGGPKLGLMDKLYGKRSRAPELTPSLKHSLYSCFEPQIIKLENILERDLSAWKNFT